MSAPGGVTDEQELDSRPVVSLATLRWDVLASD